MKRLFSLLLAVMMIVTLFAGCGGDPATPPSGDNPPASSSDEQPGSSSGNQNPVTPGQDSETPMYMYWTQSIGTDTRIENPLCGSLTLMPYMIYDQLSTLDTGTNTRYWKLAEKIEQSEDLKTITVTVRDGIKWHDGEKMTVDDVVFSFYAAACIPTSTSRQFWEGLVGGYEVQEGDAETFEGLSVEGNVITLTFKQPQPTGINDIGNTIVLPKHCFTEGIRWADFNSQPYWSNPVGTGAYKIAETKYPDYVKLVRNDNYFAEKAGIKNVTFVSYGDTNAAVGAMISGNIDFGNRQLVLDKTVADSIMQQNPNIATIVTKGYYYRFFKFRTDRDDGTGKEILLKPEIRLAINLLIDEDGICTIYGDTAETTDVLFSPSDPAYPKHLERPSTDVDEAKRLLDEYGWDYEDVLEICYYYDDINTHAIMQYVQQCFEEAGVQCDIQFIPQSEYSSAEKNFDLLYAGGNAAADYQGIQYMYLISTQSKELGDINRRKERYDALYQLYDTSVGEKRVEYAQELMKRNFEDNYIIPAYVLNNVVCYNKTNIFVPDNVFNNEGTCEYKWHEWKMLH